MSETSNSSRDRALTAAMTVFSRYGYRRTSLADVACEAGMSRPALYRWFANKAALFQALAETTRDRVLADAALAWPVGMAVAEGLPAAILAKDLPLLRLLYGSPHGAELLAADAGLTQAVARQLEAGFSALLVSRAEDLIRQGQIDVAIFGSAQAFGCSVGRLAAGLKHEAKQEAEYVADIALLCRLIDDATRLRRGPLE